MTLGPVVSDGVCCAAGAADQEDDKNAHQKVQDPGGSAGSVLINVTVIGHSMNRKSIAKLSNSLSSFSSIKQQSNRKEREINPCGSHTGLPLCLVCTLAESDFVCTCKRPVWRCCEEGGKVACDRWSGVETTDSWPTRPAPCLVK